MIVVPSTGYPAAWQRARSAPSSHLPTVRPLPGCPALAVHGL